MKYTDIIEKTSLNEKSHGDAKKQNQIMIEKYFDIINQLIKHPCMHNLKQKPLFLRTPSDKTFRILGEEACTKFFDSLKMENECDGFLDFNIILQRLKN